MSVASITCWTCAGVWLAATCSMVWGQGSSSGPVPQIYTCVDANGRKLNSDRWIVECADREQRILNPSGSVKTVLMPAPTALERQQLEAKNRGLQLAQATQAEEKKRDQSLLVRYPTPGSHQKERLAALAQVASVRQASIGQILALQAERFKLGEEMAFYQNDPSKAPPKLRARLAELDGNLATLKRVDVAQASEIDRIHARFDADALRLKPHWPAASP
jgi:hypothetical protein